MTIPSEERRAYMREYMRRYRAKSKEDSLEGKDKGYRTKDKGQYISKKVRTFFKSTETSPRKNHDPTRESPTQGSCEAVRKITVQLDLKYHSCLIELLEIWSHLESKRLISREKRQKMRDAILYMSEQSKYAFKG